MIAIEVIYKKSQVEATEDNWMSLEEQLRDGKDLLRFVLNSTD